MRACTWSKFSLALILTVLTAGVGLAQQSTGQNEAKAEFYRGYYLQHESKSNEEAVRAYQRALKLGADGKIRSAIEGEIANLQKELATKDFASLMPAESLAYVEISNPAEHLEQVARLVGLTGRQFSLSDERATLRIDNMLAVSSDFQLSPALLREFKKIGGAAVAITDLSENGPPEGIAVINPGNSDLITGLLETGIQLVPATDNIGGFPTFNIEREIWIVKANRLILISSSKTQITDCLKRVADEDSSSLADDESFTKARSKNEDAAVFAFVSPQKAVKKFEHLFRGELSIARMILDLDHMESISTALLATDNGIRSRLNVKFAEDHRSFGYGLVRTVPLSRKALGHIPAGSAAVVGMGLNPKLILAAQAAGHQQLSALDIGREVFANIEELGLFVLPSMSQSSHGIPDFGLVIASSDVAKSEALWNHLLSLPAMMQMREGPQAKDITIEGVEAREYAFGGNEIPPLVIARLGDEAMVAGTHAAVAATIKAGTSGNTLVNDSHATAFWEANSEFTSKAAFVNVGHALNLAASLERGRESQEMKIASHVIQDLVVTIIVNEVPDELEIQTDLIGLPQFDNVIKALSKMQSQSRIAGSRAFDRPAARKTVADIQVETPHVEAPPNPNR